MIIKNILARKIIDSRGEDTIEVLINGQKASSPSGKSTGKYETPPYHKSIDWNIKEINGLKTSLEFNSFSDLKKLELLIKNKFKLNSPLEFGANALFALESAILKALAKEQNKDLWQVINIVAKRLPIPIGNAVGGGLHSKHYQYRTVFQEFLLIPQEKSFIKNVASIKSNHLLLKKQLSAKFMNDEGAWQTPLDEEKILQILSKFKKIKIGVDVASSTFYKNSLYNYQDKTLSREEQLDYIIYLQNKYSILYLEDSFHEEDFKYFSKISKSKNKLIVGDDLTATHLSRIKKAVQTKAINAVIIKPNQNGSLLALQEIFNYCKKHKIITILSHRSGETLDSAIADYAFAFQADYIKCGIATKWRESKLNRLIEIESSLKK